MNHANRILGALKQGNWTYQELANILDIPEPTTRRVLGELQKVNPMVVGAGKFEGRKLFELAAV